MEMNGHQWTSMNNANRQFVKYVKSFHYVLARNPSSKRKSSATKKFLDTFRRKRKGDEQRDQKGSKGHKGSRTLKWTFHRAPNTPLISRFVDQIPRICIVEVTCGTAAWLPALRRGFQAAPAILFQTPCERGGRHQNHRPGGAGCWVLPVDVMWSAVRWAPLAWNLSDPVSRNDLVCPTMGARGALGCWCRLCRIGAIRRQNSEIPWCLIILIRFGRYHPKASGEKYDKSEAIARKLGFAVISCCSKLQLLKFRFVLTVLILPFLPEFEASGILFEQVQSLVLSSSSPFLMFFFTPASCPR